MHASRSRKRTSGFTLVEILIVVVILGILAAIVVPQFTSAADDAREGNAATQVSTLQNQIELYRAREGAYPSIADFNSEASSTDDTTWGVFIDGGYLKSAPRNPYNQSTSVAEAAGDGVGWVWDAATGTLSVNNQ